MTSLPYNNHYEFNGDLKALPRSHKFLFRLANLIQVNNSVNVHSSHLSLSIEDGISVNSLDESLNHKNTTKNNTANTIVNTTHENKVKNDVTGKQNEVQKPKRKFFNFNSSSLPMSYSGNSARLFSFRRNSQNLSQHYKLCENANEPPPDVEQYLTFQFYHNLWIPPGIAEQASQDILEASIGEPYGLRGCVVRISLKLQGYHSLFTLGHVICDPDTITTFHIELVLQEDEQKFLTKLKNMLPRKLAKRAPIIISSIYFFKKKSLYKLTDNDSSFEE